MAISNLMSKKKSGNKRPLQKRPKGNSGVTGKELTFWKENYSWGDYRKIKDETGLSRPTVQDAFDGIATSEVSEKITNYYLKKIGK